MAKMTKKFEKWLEDQLEKADWFYGPSGERVLWLPNIYPILRKAYQKGIREGKEKNQPFSGIRKLTKKTLHTSRSK